MTTTTTTPPVTGATKQPQEKEVRALTVEAGGADLLWSEAGFAHAQRIAKLFAASPLIPDHLRGKKGNDVATLANVTIALLMAKRMNEDPLITMQSIYIVSGKAGWASQYLIARANKSGVFRGRISWRERQLSPAHLEFKRKTKIGWDEGANRPIYAEKVATMPNLSVTAFATLADTAEIVAFEVTSQMAVDEGWSDNAKYSTLATLMLRYRSAAFLVRLYAPDVMLGRSTTVEELEDLDAAGRLPRAPEPAADAPTTSPVGTAAHAALMTLLADPPAAAPPPVIAAAVVEPAPDRPCPADLLAAVTAKAVALHGKGVDVAAVADEILGGIGIVLPAQLSENEARAVIRALEGQIAAT